MTGLYHWVGNLLFFLVFFTTVTAMLPSEKYGKYVRFFGGMVMILLVMQPVTKGLDLDQRIAGYMSSIQFERTSRELSKEILGVEKRRLDQMFLTYEEEVEDQIRMFAAEAGSTVADVEVSLGREEDRPDFGKVTRVVLISGGSGEAVEAKAEAAGSGMEVPENGDLGKALSGNEVTVEIGAVESVKPVEVLVGAGDGGDAGYVGDTGNAGAGEAMSQASRLTSTERRADPQMEEVKRKVEAYYGLESGKVEIQFEVR